MKLKVSLVLALLTVALSAVVAVAAPSAQSARPTGSATTDPIAGTTTSGAAVNGQFTVTSFKNVNGVIRAYGTFTGTDASGNAVSDTGYAEVIKANNTALPSTTGAASPLAAAAAPT